MAASNVIGPSADLSVGGRPVSTSGQRWRARRRSSRLATRSDLRSARLSAPGLMCGLNGTYRAMVGCEMLSVEVCSWPGSGESVATPRCGTTTRATRRKSSCITSVKTLPGRCYDAVAGNSSREECQGSAQRASGRHSLPIPKDRPPPVAHSQDGRPGLPRVACAGGQQRSTSTSTPPTTRPVRTVVPISPASSSGRTTGSTSARSRRSDCAIGLVAQVPG